MVPLSRIAASALDRTIEARLKVSRKALFFDSGRARGITLTIASSSPDAGKGFRNQAMQPVFMASARSSSVLNPVIKMMGICDPSAFSRGTD
jgi:hypothetical protein